MPLHLQLSSVAGGLQEFFASSIPNLPEFTQFDWMRGLGSSFFGRELKRHRLTPSRGFPASRVVTLRQDHQVKVHRRDFQCNLEDLDLRKIQEDLGSLEWDFDSAHEGLDLDGSDRLDSLAFCHVGCHGRLND